MLRTFDASTFRRQFQRRGFADYPREEAAVREILAAVRSDGDKAVLGFTRRFDGADLKTQLVSEVEFLEAEKAADPAVLGSLAKAAENIRRYHLRQIRNSWLETQPDGSALGVRETAIQKAGCYVPGGSAAYPSSVLMTVIPARVAGVEEVILVTPPAKDGQVHPLVLAAAKLAGADKVYKCGGAQAIAALAYGTESIPKVDKIVGPGNIYVTLAKKEVAGVVGIDMLAGPSEILIIADDSARAEFVAADLLSQAEHDALAAVYLLTTSRRLAESVQKELGRQCADLERRHVAEKSLREQGAMVVADSLEEAFNIANLLAPEHLELQLADPWAALGAIKNAGAVFLGAYTPEPVGDYFAGPSHVLPTAGAGRFSSVLSVDDFRKKTSVLFYSPAAFLACARDIERLAGAEGLGAHSRAVRLRREYLERQNSAQDQGNR